jgi:hypothetical protein
MKPRLPRKMTHVEFREQLVCELIFGRRVDAATVSSSSTISSFVYAFSAEVPGVYDLTSNRGFQDYLEENGIWKIMKKRLQNDYFKRHLDGMRHTWVPYTKENLARSQYSCYYILNNNVPKYQQKKYEKDLQKNWERRTTSEPSPSQSC